MKISLTLFVAVCGVSCVSAVTREECKADYLPATLSCIDSFAGQGSPDCDLLPIPDHSMPQNQVNDRGYWIQELRNTPTSHVFAVSQNTYNSLIIVDVPPGEDVNKRNLKASKGNLKGAIPRKLQDSSDEIGLMMEGPAETSEDGASGRVLPNDITVAFVDFPPAFETAGGNHLLSALDDILDMIGATMNDVAQVEMLYSHGHTDHIGLANATFVALTETLGFDPESIPIIAPEGVLEHFDHAIETGFFTNRAPLPTVTFTDYKEHTVGRSTTLNLTTFDGHEYGDKNVIVFMEAEGPEQPAIMMVVDIVFPKWAPFFSFALSTNLLKYISAHDTFLEFPLGEDGFLVCGHLNQVGDRNDILLNKELTLAIVNAAGLALKTVNPGPVMANSGFATPGHRNFGNSWARIDTYFAEIERVCARAVMEEYGCDFGGLDVTLYSACRAAQSFLRIEI
ncbi:Metallo-beta-lactamase superfamily [Seminavis robusta]|uniref:Metallo-beta-lactamase superfamily n=1 Tax=Seminavis robusta TaxID=568900 RepID=A0A9N8ER41_9STRA|nr:Metallo-beta-lactamase superfamily [Seminavis robusta]|eukprot:Sro1548_g281570.1 Metallo-beta-lactamase superfamily (453) ;mRNA; f:10970-12511